MLAPVSPILSEQKMLALVVSVEVPSNFSEKKSMIEMKTNSMSSSAACEIVPILSEQKVLALFISVENPSILIEKSSLIACETPKIVVLLNRV